MDIQDQLTRYIVVECLDRGEDFPLPADAKLLGKGLMDSMQMLQLIQFIEDEFEVAIEDTDLVMDNFETIGRIVTFVQRKRSDA